MSNEIVVSHKGEETRIALMRDKNLVEYHTEGGSSEFQVGDLYLGVVRRVVPGLNAAFVDVGYEKDAFLHYLDLGPNIRSLVKYSKAVLNKKNLNAKLNGFKFEPEIDKLGKMSQVLTKNQKLLVQVAKEPISSKGPRLSCELSLAGRYIVLVPFSNTLSVSRKINDANERKRLRRLIESIKPEGFGVIIRTVATGKDVKELNRDMTNLLNKWETARKNLKSAKPADRVLGEESRTASLIRDILNDSFDSVTVDDPEYYENIKAFTAEIAPDKEDVVKLYNGKQKIFENRGIEKQIKALFGKSVSLSEGGYLIIEHTEALHVVDVNSGNKSNSQDNQEETALSTNLDSVREMARQLRLRDMGGIIVIDFIDMRKAENRKLVYEKMRDELKKDSAKSVVLPLSKFGLMQITRQRVRPENNVKTAETCPTCGGAGTISASIAIADIIANNIEFLLKKQNQKSLKVSVHPYLYAYFTKGGMKSMRWAWFWKFKRWVTLEEDSSLGMTKYRVVDKNGEEIEIF